MLAPFHEQPVGDGIGHRDVVNIAPLQFDKNSFGFTGCFESPVSLRNSPDSLPGFFHKQKFRTKARM